MNAVLAPMPSHSHGSSHQGCRKHQQDAHTVNTHEGYTFFGIFDGKPVS